MCRLKSISGLPSTDCFFQGQSYALSHLLMSAGARELNITLRYDTAPLFYGHKTEKANLHCRKCQGMVNNRQLLYAD